MPSDHAVYFPVWAWIPLFALLFSQALWIYLDAAKRGERKFLWGFFGLLNFPSSLFAYLIATRVFAKTRPCGACGKAVPKGARFCPHCGKLQAEGNDAA
jgi:hypothetical protein